MGPRRQILLPQRPEQNFGVQQDPGISCGLTRIPGNDFFIQGWNTVTLTGTIPGGVATAMPLFIVADGGFGAGAPNGTGSGAAVYIDNINFTVGLQSAAIADTPVAPTSLFDASPIVAAAVGGSFIEASERNAAIDTADAALLIYAWIGATKSTLTVSDSANDKALTALFDEETNPSTIRYAVDGAHWSSGPLDRDQLDAVFGSPA